MSSVGFTAYPSELRSYTCSDPDDEPLILDSIMTDTTNSYDPIAYSFTCPVTGLYLFSLSLLNQNGFYARAQIFVDGFDLAVSYSNDGTSDHFFSHSTNTVVTNCEKGQRVWVDETCTSNAAVHHEKNILFSGALISME